MSNYAPYGQYSPCSSGWIDVLPLHWRFVSLRWLSSIYAGGTPSKTNEKYWESGSIPWINSGAVNQVVIKNPSAYITEEAFRNSSAKWIPANSLVMALAGQGKTKGMVAQISFDLTCNQSMAAIVLNDNKDSRYIFWWLQSNYLNIRNMSGGDLRDGLNLEHLGDIKCPLPPESECVTIAAFLDRETAKIDTLIEKQEQLIKLLKEKRQAVISHAVTKGLNPDAPMKDSGVEWFGEVPAHWYTSRVKQVSSFITSGPRGWSDYICDEGLETFLQSGDLNNELEILSNQAKRVSPPHGSEGVRTKLRAGDIVVCITGANTGRVAVVSKIESTTYINQHLSLVRPIKDIVNSKYLGYALASNVGRSFFDVMQYGLKEGLSLSNVGEVPFAVPPLAEQQEIVDLLNRKLKALKKLTNQAELQIDLLYERRTALISAAVTGKIDVRSFKADSSDAA